MDIASGCGALASNDMRRRFAKTQSTTRSCRSLTAEDLKDIGVAIVGHRRKLLDAIAALRADANAKAALSEPTRFSRHRRAPPPHSHVLLILLARPRSRPGLDPEDMRERHRRLSPLLRARSSSESGGFVARYMGDGVLAYFGYPQAHEDDAEHAVRAGLALIDGGGEARCRRGDALARAGRHCHRPGGRRRSHRRGRGAGARGGRRDAQSGRAASGAGRAGHGGHRRQHAPIARRTFRISRSRQLSHSKASASRCRSWQVLGASAAESRFEALAPARPTPLVGRDEEIELLLRRWQQAKRGEGCVVLISGEPGIGKSRSPRPFWSG